MTEKGINSLLDVLNADLFIGDVKQLRLTAAKCIEFLQEELRSRDDALDMSDEARRG